MKPQSLIELGLQLASEGKYELARENFKKANREFRTAESLTYWGWMEYQLGNIEKAISLCQKAIQLDPDFGNPYNDVGSYLVVLGQEEEAIEWFEKAIEAKRYEARHYPHINLGRIFLRRNLLTQALQEFKKAEKYSPLEPSLQEAIRLLVETLH